MTSPDALDPMDAQPDLGAFAPQKHHFLETVHAPTAPDGAFSLVPGTSVIIVAFRCSRPFFVCLSSEYLPSSSPVTPSKLFFKDNPLLAPTALIELQSVSLPEQSYSTKHSTAILGDHSLSQFSQKACPR